MSLLSRQPYQSTVPASWPKLVERTTGAVDRAAIRKELRTRWTGPTAAPASRVLAIIMQKVRLQRRWALEDIETDKQVRARVEQERQELDIAAQALAERCNYDTGHLRYQRDRYAFGSLAETWRAPRVRKLYARALDIALDHHDAPLAPTVERNAHVAEPFRSTLNALGL